MAGCPTRSMLGVGFFGLLLGNSPSAVFAGRLETDASQLDLEASQIHKVIAEHRPLKDSPTSSLVGRDLSLKTSPLSSFSEDMVDHPDAHSQDVEIQVDSNGADLILESENEHASPLGEAIIFPMQTNKASSLGQISSSLTFSGEETKYTARCPAPGLQFTEKGCMGSDACCLPYIAQCYPKIEGGTNVGVCQPAIWVMSTATLAIFGLCIAVIICLRHYCGGDPEDDIAKFQRPLGPPGQHYMGDRYSDPGGGMEKLKYPKQGQKL